MSRGTVTYFNDTKGWGIISSEDLQQDVYVHYTNINMDGFQTLARGQEVLFEVTDSKAGLKAQNVTPTC